MPATEERSHSLSTSGRRSAFRSVAITLALLPFISTRIRRNPFPLYRFVQRLEPIHRSPFGIWVVTGHEETLAVLKHPDVSNAEANADVSLVKVGRLNRLMAREKPFESSGPFMALHAEFMPFRDPPDHTRLRDAIGETFSARQLQGFQGTIDRLADDLLDEIEPRGAMDVVNEFAYPLSARVLCAYLGVSLAYEARITPHSPALATGLNPSPLRTTAMLQRADRAAVAMTDLVNEIIRDKRDEPDDSAMSRLVNADAGALTDRELVVTILGTMFAGHETTASLVAMATRALLQHPEQFQRLRQDSSLIRTAVEEVHRFAGPFSTLQRVALEDVDICGTRIPKGSIIAVCLAAANRDRRVFANPDRLDVTRSPNPQLGFGAGIHRCPGAALGRLTVNAAVAALVRRFPRLVLTSSRWRDSFTIRGLERLHVRW